ncbi:MAG TPA: sigma-70 family RNA polymerase sigma factor [Blastocatellia bacterium]|nr:sigma-70 family RNA polymerase sigma factor [Blastocatellia bacterium]HMY74115.1 sigma-70 family RNA polymerase sigma factor [Blastocatellia bacterium]
MASETHSEMLANQLIEKEFSNVAMQRAETQSQPEQVLAHAKTGDQTAFAELVREHQSMVYSLARYFLRDAAIAEDLAQEVFIHLYQNLASIESAAHLKFYLRKVTSHRCIDYARRQKSHAAKASVSLDEAPEPASVIEMPDSMLRGTLRRFVSTLPEKPRLVVTLRYQEDLDPTEIAQVLDMPINTVKSHLRRSLAILREKVSRTLGEVQV